MNEINNLETDLRGWDFIGALLSSFIAILPFYLVGMRNKWLLLTVPAMFAVTAATSLISKSSFRMRWGWSLIAFVSSTGVGIIYFIIFIIDCSRLSVEDTNNEPTSSFAIMALIIIAYQLVISLIVMAVVHYSGYALKRSKYLA